MQVDQQREDQVREEARERPSTLRNPVLALASVLGCREGQAYSVVVAGIIAVLLAALGIPPVLLHHPRAVAVARPAPPPTAASGTAPPPSQPALPDVTGPAAPATELPALIPPAALPLGDSAALPSAPAQPPGDASPVMTGTGATLKGQEGT